jgi:hypothetical protein
MSKAVAIFALFAAGAVAADLPPASGRIAQEKTGDFETLPILGSKCRLVNNTWNKHAAPAGFRQSVFLEDRDGGVIGGWRWSAPSQPFATVVSQPQIVCGDKPWDPPGNPYPGFPFRAGDKRLAIDFDVGMKAKGQFNLTFTLWAVSALPANRQTLSHEIMIWTAEAFEGRAGKNIGSVTANGTTFDVFVEPGHRDNSGAVTFTWTYVAFIARKPMLKGTLDTGVLMDFLIERGLLKRDAYLTSLELGNEVLEGTGVVELKRMDLNLLAR